ncbi:MAG: SDR family NAD(P)-dependent oxidoreductase [Proteobacteria bacterium]|nr:SDR family NAD(P)-dependent oxidoreductase [Pseudomonadota bacterium]
MNDDTSQPDVAVVTGAGRGLGRAIAERLARRAFHVIVADVDEVAAHATASAIGGTASALDVRDPDAHREVARRAATLGPLALWVNNAGVLAVGDSWTLAPAVVRRMVEVNLLGVIWGTHAAIDAGVSHVINIASMSALVPTPGLAVYGATKHGVLGFSLSLAGELARAQHPTRISTLCPDAIAGDMTKAVAHDAAAAILFSSGTLLAMDAVADAAVELVDRPQLVRSIPALRAALIHLLRPFPTVGLQLLERFAQLGRRRQR